MYSKENIVVRLQRRLLNVLDDDRKRNIFIMKYKRCFKRAYLKQLKTTSEKIQHLLVLRNTEALKAKRMEDLKSFDSIMFDIEFSQYLCCIHLNKIVRNYNNN